LKERCDRWAFGENAKLLSRHRQKHSNQRRNFGPGAEGLDTSHILQSIEIYGMYSVEMKEAS
jgi:hypothetical protein